MDISGYSTKKSATETHKEVLNNPTNGLPFEHDGKTMFAKIVSKNSKSYEAALSRIVNAAREADKYGVQDFKVSVEKMKKANLCAACTRHLFFFEKGNWVDISNTDSEDDAAQHKAIRDAYLEYDWMLDQVDLAIARPANFLGKSEPTLPAL